MKYIFFALLVVLTLCLFSTALAETAVVETAQPSFVWKWWTIGVCAGGLVLLMCLWSYQVLHPTKRKRGRRRRKSSGQT